MTDQFFRTPMGRKFYESTAPALVSQVSRLNDNIERLLSILMDPPTSPGETARKPKEQPGEGKQEEPG